MNKSKYLVFLLLMCSGISFGAAHDIKEITTLMDAYEKQLDNIKLKYTYKFPMNEKGDLVIVKGTFAQKQSEGLVLLDERKQIAQEWDDSNEIEGILRSYDGKITRYLEHEENDHGYHMAAIYKNHDPKLYKNQENPFYLFYRVNYNKKVIDLLNDPKSEPEIQGEEIINGLKAIKIQFNKFDNKFENYIWLLPDKNYLPLKVKRVYKSDGKNFWQCNWGDFRKFKDNIWLPTKIETTLQDAAQPTTLQVEEVDFTPLTKEDFKFEFPALTHVTDHILGTKYLTTQTMEMSGIEEVSLVESSLSNEQKESVLDQYIESGKATAVSKKTNINAVDSELIVDNVKPKDSKSGGFSYLLFTLIISAVIIISAVCVYAKRRKG